MNFVHCIDGYTIQFISNETQMKLQLPLIIMKLKIRMSYLRNTNSSANEYTSVGHKPVLDTSECWTQTSVGHKPVLDTSECWTQASAGHKPVLHTNECCTQTSAGHKQTHIFMPAVCNAICNG